MQIPPVDELGIDAPALIHLQVDIVGAYDVREQALSIDAVLRDSHVALLPITGSLVVRARFGDDPTFILAVGGFHPRFTDLPPGIPPQDRVGIELRYGIVTVRIVGYVAITSNSFQIGAEASLVAAGGGFRVEAYLGFDALFVFEPVFHFEIDFRVGASVKYKSISLASVKVHGHARRARAAGRSRATPRSRSCSSTSASTSRSAWGERPAPALPSVAVGAADRRGAVGPGDLARRAARRRRRSSRLRTVDAGDDVLAHPLGSLVGVQKVVPLGIDIDRVGRSVPDRRQPLRHHRRHDRRRRRSDAPSFRDEHFARGEYLDLTEEDKLSTPSFERFRAGVAVVDRRLRRPGLADRRSSRSGRRSTCARSRPPERPTSCPRSSLVLHAALRRRGPVGDQCRRAASPATKVTTVDGGALPASPSPSAQPPDVAVAGGVRDVHRGRPGVGAATAGRRSSPTLAELEVKP